MAIKSIQVCNHPTFPKLMILETHDNKEYMIVLFKKECEGVVIQTNEDVYKIGEYSDSWNMKKFKDFNDSIVLKNK